MKSRWVAASVFVASAVPCAGAHAQRDIGEEQQIMAAPRADMRRQGSEEIVSNRREIEASSEMVFVTTRGPMAGVPQLYFTDLGLWRVHAAVTPVSGLRLTATGTFLPKQPATLDEPFWQTAPPAQSASLVHPVAQRVPLHLKGAQDCAAGGAHSPCPSQVKAPV